MKKQFTVEEYLKGGYKVVTRGGESEVEILKTDARGDRPVVGIVRYPQKDEVLTWTAEGMFDAEEGECCLDLMLVTESKLHKMWHVHYVTRHSDSPLADEDGNYYNVMSYRTEEDAKSFSKWCEEQENMDFIKVVEDEVEF